MAIDTPIGLTRGIGCRTIPKPHAGFGLPVCLYEDKMRPFGPVRSLNEEECFALVYVLASAHFLWFRFLVVTIWEARVESERRAGS